jgi:hypothetical protein
LGGKDLYKSRSAVHSFFIPIEFIFRLNTFNFVNVDNYIYPCPPFGKTTTTSNGTQGSRAALCQMGPRIFSRSPCLFLKFKKLTYTIKNIYKILKLIKNKEYNLIGRKCIYLFKAYPNAYVRPIAISLGSLPEHRFGIEYLQDFHWSHPPGSAIE